MTFALVEEKFACCPNNYSIAIYTFYLKQRSLYYTVNLIIPCIIMSFMNILGFLLPPESGEKISLGNIELNKIIS